jgi:chromate transporter
MTAPVPNDPSATLSIHESPASYAEIIWVFLYLGATTFGGMWAATQKMEAILVRKKRWLAENEVEALMVAATLIPAPKFLAFGGLVGYRLRGWFGSVLGVVALVAPGTVFVLLCAILLNPTVIGAPLVPIRRAVEIGVIGLLLGNAVQQLKGIKAGNGKKIVGFLLAAGVTGASMAGLPLMAAALAGIVIGALLLRDGEEK